MSNQGSIDSGIGNAEGNSGPETEAVYGPSRISEEIDMADLSSEGQDCLNETRKFCHETTDAFRLKILESLYKERKNGAPISQVIQDTIIEKEFDLPVFTVMNSKKAEEFVKNLDLRSTDLDSDELLLIFQLPKPLSHFWWKGGANQWGENAVDIQGTSIEWGKLYREVMPVVWDKIGFYENEKDLDFWRLNDVGVHNHDKFYYVWKISKW